MKSGKRVTAFLLAIILLVSNIPFSSYANEAGESGSTEGSAQVQTTDPVSQEPAAQEPEETKAQETEPQETEAQETEAQETEAQETEAQETEAQETEAQETEAQETEPQETEAEEASAEAYFRVQWENTAYSGRNPDISRDIRVYTADGMEVSNVSVSRAEGRYAVSGLARGDYVLKCLPAEGSGYSVSCGELTLHYVSGENAFVASGAISAALDTAALYVTVVTPEGAALPADFAPRLYLDGAALAVEAARTQSGVFVFSDLYIIDGTYTLHLPQVEDLTPVGGYEVQVNAGDGAVTVEYQQSQPTASFTIYWDDNGNRSGRRTQQAMSDMLRFYTVCNGTVGEAPLSGLEITAEYREESEIPGFEKITYTVSGIPAGLAAGTELRMVWEEDALPGYEGVDTAENTLLAESFGPQTLYLEQDAYTAGKAYAFTLPEFTTQILVNGLDESAASALQAAFRVTRYDFESDSLVPYYGFRAERMESGFEITGLYTTYVDSGFAYPTYYTVTWPREVGNFLLNEEQDNSMTAGASAGTTYSAEGNGNAGVFVAQTDWETLVIEHKAEGTVTSVKSILWFDTTNEYSHDGELLLQVPVTINGITHSFALSWDAGKQQYVHDWRMEDLTEIFGLQGEGENQFTEQELTELLAVMKPLTVTDTGSNNLNRNLTASTTKTLAVYSTQYGTTTRTKAVDISIGEIAVTGVSYQGGENDRIKAYEIGTSNGGITTFYPMVDVTFTLEFKNGDDPVDSAYLDYIRDVVRLVKMDAGGTETQITSETIRTEWGIAGFDLSTHLRVGEVGRSTEFTLRLPEYDSGKKQADYAITCPAAVHYNGDEQDTVYAYYYRAEHDNSLVPGHGTQTDRTYAGGTLILTRTGQTEFTFHKLWIDNVTDPEERPDASFMLYRYPRKGSGDYTTAAMVEMPILDENGEITGYRRSAAIPKTADENTGIIDISVGLLEKYDPDGFPYVYFVRENQAASGYQQIMGRVTGSNADGTPIVVYNTEIPGYPIAVQQPDDRGIYQDGYISNRKSDTLTLSVTKNWNAAYYQDRLSSIAVTMTLYARFADPAYGDDVFTVKTVTLDGFDALTTSNTATVTVDKYDGQGRELVFWWEETSVTQDGQTVPVGAAAETISFSQDAEGTADSGQGEAITYVLPMNRETMDATGSVRDIEERFAVTSVVDRGTCSTVFTNQLEGTTLYWIKKSWDEEAVKTDVSFTLYQVDKSGAMGPYQLHGQAAVFTLEAEDPSYHGGLVSDWIAAFPELPQYDENGNRYDYIAKEDLIGGAAPLSSYNQDADADGIREPNSVHVHNGVGEGGRTINVRKVWLDDSAATDRAPVFFDVRTEDGTLLYGAGGVLGGSVRVDDTFNWMETVDVSVYTDGSRWITRTEYTQLEENTGWSLYRGGFRVTEVQVGEGELAAAVGDTPDTAAGYRTVRYGSTQYAVIYDNSTNQNHLYTDQTTTVNGEEFYTVTNLRFGTVRLSVRKVWEDDSTVDRSLFAATVTVDCTDDTQANPRLKNGEDSFGYARVHTAIYAGGWQPIYGDSAGTTQVGLTQDVYIPQDQGDETFVYYDLPLYDENGKLLHYAVSETVERKTDGEQGPQGSYIHSSSGITYTRDGSGGLEGSQTIVNTFQNTRDVTFYLLWLDQYRVQKDQRPDMYMTLFKTVYEYNKDNSLKLDEDGNPVTRIEQHSYMEYLWGGENAKVTGDFWSYTFQDLPEYDAHGNKITYYATLKTHVNDGEMDYLEPQYAQGAVADYNAFLVPGTNKSTVSGSYTVTTVPDGGVVGAGLPKNESNTVPVLAEENTFVKQLKNDVTLVGKKVWEEIPEGFPVEGLPRLNFVLVRNGVPAPGSGEKDYRDELDRITTTPDAGNEVRIAAILGYQSPSADYSFRMLYTGLNEITADGTCVSVPADRIISSVEGLEGYTPTQNSTALDVWMWLANIPGEMREVAAKYYGTPLPKYNGKGVMYSYEVVESAIAPDTEGYTNGRVILSNSINEYTIVNTFQSETGRIDVKKSWTQQMGTQTTAPDDGFLYPAMEFTLYRFCKLSENADAAAVYSEPVAVDTVTLSGSEVKAIAEGSAANGIYATFGVKRSVGAANPDAELKIYAPNGEPYIYYVAEKKINGYNNYPANTASPTVQISEGTENRASLNGMRVITDEYWYSDCFSLNAQSQEDASPSVTYGNNYTGLEQTSVTGSKTWNDFGNAFGTRPDTLTLYLYRYVSGMAGREKIAQITLNAGSTASVIALEEGIVNMTSALAGNQVGLTASIQADSWSFTVTNLDKYASNGLAWAYSIEEPTPPEGYTVSGSGMNLSNDLRTSLEVRKNWTDENGNPLLDNIALPSVEVKLQVSVGTTDKWQDAFPFFSGFRDPNVDTNGDGDFNESDFVRTLTNGRWRAIFQNLPVGIVQDGTYAQLSYRAVETSVGGAAVNTDTGSFGGGSVAEQLFPKVTVLTNSVGTTGLQVTKVWDDSDNAFDTRYLSGGNWTVSFRIYRKYGSDTVETLTTADGGDYILTVTGTGKSGASASGVLTGLPAKTPNGQTYTYYAVELNPDGSEVAEGSCFYGGYTASYKYGGMTDSGFSTAVTNTLITTRLAVTKQWQGDSGQGLNFRPGTLSLKLKQNGKDITGKYPGVLSWSTDGNRWTVEYTSLPKYDSDGNPFTYQVEESRQDGYQVPLYVFTPADGQAQGEDNPLNVHSAEITNVATRFRMDKISEDGKPLNDVELVFAGTQQIHGATYKLTWRRSASGEESYEIRKSGTVISAGAVTAGHVDIIGLPEGTYELTSESRVPEGFYASALIGARFTLSSKASADQKTATPSITGTAGKLVVDSSGSVPLLKAVNKKTTLSIEKWGDGNRITSGWQFGISGRFADGATYYTYPGTDFTGKLIVGELYTMQETVNPAGYIKSDVTVTFRLNSQNQVEIVSPKDGPAEASGNTLIFTDEPFVITISKHAVGTGLLGGRGPGIYLAGARFKLYDGSGNLLTQELEIGAGGLRLSSLYADGTALFRTSESAESAVCYRLVETKAPDGYILPDTAPYVEFWFNERGQVQIVQKNGADAALDVLPDGNWFQFYDDPISLTLVKYDGGDFFAEQKRMAGVEFTLSDGSGGKKTFTTDDRGEITFGPGDVVGGKTYTLTETAVSGFEPLSFVFTVNPNGRVSLTDPPAGVTVAADSDGRQISAVNERIPGTIILTKFTKLDDTTYTLNGARFSLYRYQSPDNWIQWIWQFFTGEQYELVSSGDGTALTPSVKAAPGDGKLVISNLPWGRYKLVETAAPDGFKLEDVSIDFTVDADNLTVTIDPDSEVKAENVPFTFTFSKHSRVGAIGSSGLAGAQFKLYARDGEALTEIQTSQSLVTDAKGEVTLCSVEEAADGTLRAILKTSSQDTRYVYRLVETKAPDGYILPQDSPYVEFRFNDQGQAQIISRHTDVTDSFQFLDDPILLTLVKYDGGDFYAQQTTLDGVQFTVQEKGKPETAGTVTTHDGGKITFGLGQDYPVVGGRTYILTELERSGYGKLDSFEVTVNTDGTFSMTDAVNGVTLAQNTDGRQIKAVNERILGTVTLMKYTQFLGEDEKHPLDGAVFSLYREEQAVTWWEKLKDFVTGTHYDLVWSTDGNALVSTTESKTGEGDLIISNLPWGTYTLKETQAPEGYKLVSNAYTFTIGPEDPQTGIDLTQNGTVANECNRLVVRKVAAGDESRRALTGAQYKLYQNVPDENGGTALVEITNTADRLQPMWIWDPNTGTGEASCLSVGDYTLVETRAPYGYTVAKPVTFHMDEYGTVTVAGKACETLDGAPMLFAEDVPTKFTFTKAELFRESCAENAGQTRILPGVTFTAYEDAQLTKVIGTAVSDESGTVTFTALPLKDYRGEGTETAVYIRETETLPGHVLDEQVYLVYVDSCVNDRGEAVSNAVLRTANGALADNTVINDVFRGDFIFTKASELDGSLGLPGAEYGLYKTAVFTVGEVEIPYETLVARAVSDGNGRVCFAGLLMDVTYTVRELSAPGGSYLSANSVSFTYAWENGQAVLTMLDTGDGTVTEQENGLQWKEPQTVISIQKVTSGGTPLAGATLQLQDEDGNPIPIANAQGETVDSWVSTRDPFVITGQLQAGESYWLCELKAPAGYVLAKRVKFTVPQVPVEPGEEKVIYVEMKNYRESEIPKTGDSTPLLRYMALLLLSAGGLIGAAAVGRRRRRT